MCHSMPGSLLGLRKTDPSCSSFRSSYHLRWPQQGVYPMFTSSTLWYLCLLAFGLTVVLSLIVRPLIKRAHTRFHKEQLRQPERATHEKEKILKKYEQFATWYRLVVWGAFLNAFATVICFVLTIAVLGEEQKRAAVYTFHQVQLVDKMATAPSGSVAIFSDGTVAIITRNGPGQGVSVRPQHARSYDVYVSTMIGEAGLYEIPHLVARSFPVIAVVEPTEKNYSEFLRVYAESRVRI